MHNLTQPQEAAIASVLLNLQNLKSTVNSDFYKAILKSSINELKLAFPGIEPLKE